MSCVIQRVKHNVKTKADIYAPVPKVVNEVVNEVERGKIEARFSAGPRLSHWMKNKAAILKRGYATSLYLM